VNKRPIDNFALAVYRWHPPTKEWIHIAWIDPDPAGEIMQFLLKGILYSGDQKYVAVEKMHGREKGTFTYYTGSNGDVERYQPVRASK